LALGLAGGEFAEAYQANQEAANRIVLAYLC
jgi:hypothetical protein